MKKKVIAIWLAVIILLGFDRDVYAYVNMEDFCYSSLFEITTEEISSLALNVASEFQPSLTLEVGEIIPMYDMNDIPIGFSVSYVKNSIPYGYVNLDFTNQNLVSEISIFKNVKGKYEEVSSKVVSVCNEKEQNIEKKLFCMGTLQYAVSLEDKEGVVVYPDGSEEVLSEDNADSAMVYDRCEDVIIDSYNNGAVSITKPTYTKKYNKSDSIITDSRIKRITGKYACAVVALTEIAKQEGILKQGNIADDKIKNTFNQIWKNTETTVYDTDKEGIKLGKTKDINLKPGMKEYVTAMGKNNTKITDKQNPDISFFKDIITSNASGTLTFRVQTKAGKEGHTVNVVGYCVARLNGVFSDYLIVADGWDSTVPRYINMTSTDFVDTYGIKYVIK